MQYFYITLALLCGGFGMWAVAATMGLKAARKEIDDLKKAAAKEVQTDAQAAAQDADKVARLEKVIADQKKELEQMEADLAANPDPAVARARLSKLLSQL